jgi:hypothetical protein
MAVNMILPLVLSAAAAGTPVKIDGEAVGKLVLSGGAKIAGPALSVNGGLAKLAPAEQKALDEQIKGQPFALLVELKDATAGNATALTLGPLKFGKKAGNWFVSAGDGTVQLGKAAAGTLKAVVVADGSNLRAFKAGKAAGFAAYSSTVHAPLTIGGTAGQKWKGTLLQLDIIPRSIMPQAAVAMSKIEMANSTPITLDAELVAATVVPDPKSVLPYKHALVTQDYKVVSIASGGVEGVEPGVVIRVARWGIINGKKTSIATLKKGAKVILTLGRVEDFPSLEREFTVDKLPDNFDAPYLIDAERPNG